MDLATWPLWAKVLGTVVVIVIVIGWLAFMHYTSDEIDWYGVNSGDHWPWHW